MKILNLKFKNINSLVGESEIDFTLPKFTDSGLFVITGKTGAGKSSILDAISLALYGKTPRVDITGSTNDVMTHGEKDCYAEIVFETNGKRWAATWKQERTRTGTLKQIERIIADENKKIVADKNKECEKKIVEIIGLTFEQFTKVIMLAQGSFAAFLQAEKNDKGELLEQITGTEIYGEISKKVFERHKTEKEKLDKIIFELGTIQILSDEELENLDKEIADFVNKKSLIDNELKTIDTAIKWLGDLENLKKQIAENSKKFPELETKENKAKNDLQISENELKNAKEEQKKTAPVLVKVRELDTKIEEKEKLLKTITNTLEDIESEGKTLAKKITQQQKTLAELQVNLRSKNEWKEQNQKYESLIGKYTAIENQNTQVVELHKDLLSKQQNNTDAEKDLNSKIEKLKQARIDFDSKHILLEQQNTEIVKFKKSFSEALNGEELSVLQKAKETAIKEIQNINSLIDNFKTIISESKNIVDCEKILSGNTQKFNELEQKIKEGNKDVDNLKQQIKLLEDNIALTKTIQSLDEHRKLLTDGKECPLCGAAEHPFAKGNVPQIGEKQQQFNDLKQQLNTLEKSIQKDEKQCVALKSQSENETANKEKSQRIVNETREKNEKLLPLLKDFNFEESDDCVAKLNVLCKNKLDEQIKIKEQIESAEKIERQIKNLQEVVIPKVQQQEDVAKSAKNDAQTAKLIAEKLKETTENNVNETKKMLETTNTSLQNSLNKYEVTTIESLKKCLDSWNKNEEEILKLTEYETQLKAYIQININSKDEKLKNFETRKTEKQTVENEKQSTANERIILFGDKKADVEEQRLRYLVESKETANTKAADAKTAITTEFEKIKAVIEQNKKQLAKKQAENLTDKSHEDLQTELNEKKTAVDEFSQKIGANMQTLNANAEKSKNSSNKLKTKESQEQILYRWAKLNELIGSADGKKYRNFAQALTFEHLIGLANRQLRKMSERYVLKRTGDANNPFELSVIDHFQNCDKRTVQNLSGGEKFIVSLALALGLANMASHNMRINTMFIDEGFGTLDSDYLDIALTALSNLQNEGKLIGVISHLTELKERITAHIEVIPKGNGHSAVKI